MATTSCPNCGKPLRPGARFCGNCGYTIPATPSAQAGPPPAGPATIACPQCGKPVRVGAKFCSHCGKVLQQEPPVPAIPVPPSPSVPPVSPVDKSFSSPTMKPAAQPQPAAAPAVNQQAGAPSARVSTPSQSKAGAGRKMMWPLVVLVVAAICVLGGGGMYLYFKDPFGWQAVATANPTAPAPSQTPEPVLTATATIIELSTQNPPPPTPTLPVPPTVTATLTVTMEISPTILFTPAAPVTGTTPSVAPVILLNDYFNDALNINWKAWGSPRPILRSGPGDNWLDLTATEKPDTAGVTTRIVIANEPGNVIEFEGQLNPNYANFPLFFDWDPLQFDRGPENTEPTVLHLEILNNRIVLRAPAANNACQKEFEGAKQHRFMLKFVAEKKVELYIDGNNQAICQLDMGIKAIPGRISFSGTGWVSHVAVTGSNPS
jgi:predicted nucleic acid-binding Zn ribbon protein